MDNCNKCHDGYWLDENQCQKCHFSCQLCSSQGCETCQSNRELVENNQCQCIDGYWENRTESCGPCNSSCNSCNGGSQQNCLSCSDNKFLRSATKECIECHHSCYSCVEESINSCSICPDQSNRQINISIPETEPHSCPCDDGYYDDGSSSDCQTCHYSCVTCKGGSDQNCLSCSDGFYLQFQTGMCKTCSNSCVTCIGGGLDDCLICPQDSFRDLNIGIIDSPHSCPCNDGFYDDGKYPQCKPCNDRCLTCQGPSDTDCIIACDESCSKCLIKPEYCTACANNYTTVLDITNNDTQLKKCFQECPRGFEPDTVPVTGNRRNLQETGLNSVGNFFKDKFQCLCNFVQMCIREDQNTKIKINKNSKFQNNSKNSQTKKCPIKEYYNQKTNQCEPCRDTNCKRCELLQDNPEQEIKWYIQCWELLRKKAYKLPHQEWYTIGYGHHSADVKKDGEYSLVVANQKFEKDFQLQKEQAKEFLQQTYKIDFDSLSFPRQAVILDMFFNLRLTTVKQFQNLYQHLQNQQYKMAAFEITNSKYGRVKSSQQRAKKNKEFFENDIMPVIVLWNPYEKYWCNSFQLFEKCIECMQGFYYNKTEQICKQCNNGCLNCSGPEIKDCKSCTNQTKPQQNQKLRLLGLGERVQTCNTQLESFSNNTPGILFQFQIDEDLKNKYQQALYNDEMAGVEESQSCPKNGRQTVSFTILQRGCLLTITSLAMTIEMRQKNDPQALLLPNQSNKIALSNIKFRLPFWKTFTDQQQKVPKLMNGLGYYLKFPFKAHGLTCQLLKQIIVGRVDQSDVSKLRQISDSISHIFLRKESVQGGKYIILKLMRLRKGGIVINNHWVLAQSYNLNNFEFTCYDPDTNSSPQYRKSTYYLYQQDSIDNQNNNNNSKNYYIEKIYIIDCSYD